MKKNNPTEFDRYLGLESFTNGNSTDAYRYFGSHPDTQDDISGYRFLVWAPNASALCVMGDFNGWNDSSHPLTRLEGGIWEGFIPGLQQYDSYKYAVHTHDGRILAKTDPYAFHCETRPDNASKLYPLDQYQWNDDAWLKHRKKTAPYDAPMNIYECHLGSWRRNGEGEFLTYRESATLLVPYLKEMGYTHVEFLPIMEHPLDESWGYQVSGFYSATSRFGTPDDFKYLVDQLHLGGISVILDWVPAHFPRDAFGLYQFDGTPTYEYPDPTKGERPQWGTNAFDLGRPEVRSFLFSSAMYWLTEFHVDGLRVDAVSSMLYLSFGREDGGWAPNVHGGEENIEAIQFLRDLNTLIFSRYPNALMIAEESSAWGQVTGPVDAGGLGFNFKWNMGWMNDMCHYLKQEPLARQHHHKDLTFSLMYAFNENYVLPFSHDEVVHKKSSYLGKMKGDTYEKLSASRAFYAYQLAHPGKMLTFMGAEFGQWNEWCETYSLDWHLLEHLPHQQIQEFHRQINQFYLETPSLWEQDTSWAGFQWLYADDNLGNTVAFARYDKKGNPLAVVCNFSPVHRNGYRLPLPNAGVWQEVFNTDWAPFGGADNHNGIPLTTTEGDYLGKEHSIEINLPPNSAVMFRCISTPPKKATRTKKTDEPKQSSESAPKKIGRPKKDAEPTTLKKVGRPKKVAETTSDAPKKVGRPKKVVDLTAETPKKIGRPKKDAEPAKKVGRPKKVVDLTAESVKKVGRPKKITRTKKEEKQ
ncbi:MAG: 1,4-alpha-glucan branching protein GlgB [Eubacteriales bacterium]